VIERQFRFIEIDPYANAFNADGTVWERKFELDSLAYPVELASDYWIATGDSLIFSARFRSALTRIVSTLEVEQHHATQSTYSHSDLDGSPAAETGMIWNGFRPSDDPCRYHYPIAAEVMTAAALRRLAALAEAGFQDSELARRARSLADAVDAGVARFGKVHGPGGALIYAYEVDGLGHASIMDDANVPSLLSLPLHGEIALDDPTYRATRRFVLSAANPYFYEGPAARGIGSPHTPNRYVWPLALVTQAMTAGTETERSDLIAGLVDTTPADHLLHESFSVDEPDNYTRAEFGWPNALFAELLIASRPEILDGP
jgi:meiotically up-regulated gene 157 (Mug157) protein